MGIAFLGQGQFFKKLFVLQSRAEESNSNIEKLQQELAIERGLKRNEIVYLKGQRGEGGSFDGDTSDGEIPAEFVTVRGGRKNSEGGMVEETDVVEEESFSPGSCANEAIDHLAKTIPTQELFFLRQENIRLAAEV